MASIYLRGDVLWVKFKGSNGKAVCKSSGYRRGQEALARALAAEVERQAAAGRDPAEPATARVATGRTARVLPMPAARGALRLVPPVDAAPAERIGADAPAEALTVAAYCEEWLKRRGHVATAKDEATRLRLHVLPLIGHMAIAQVRPRHIRDLMTAIGNKTSEAPKCKGERLAPRTVLHVFSTLRLMFKGAVIDEHIDASPVVVEAGTLPANVDKDPEWRSTAIFERDELIAIVSDPRIADYRRVFYALEGLAGVRHSEAAALRWRDYNPSCAPLGKLLVARSGEKQRTKTKVTREIPVHPSLAIILDAWKADGWAGKYGRAPEPDDLVLPTERNQIRKPADTLKVFHRDLALIGLRPRRGHDLRRTFVTLARVDGGRAEVLRPLTHPGDSDIIGLYTSFPWPTICAELAKLQLPLPAQPATTRPALAADARAAEQIVDGGGASYMPSYSASYTASYSPDCSPGIMNAINDMQSDTGVGQRFRKP